LHLDDIWVDKAFCPVQHAEADTAHRRSGCGAREAAAADRSYTTTEYYTRKAAADEAVSRRLQ
jgi:hypothetical protein